MTLTEQQREIIRKVVAETDAEVRAEREAKAGATGNKVLSIGAERRRKARASEADGEPAISIAAGATFHVTINVYLGGREEA